MPRLIACLDVADGRVVKGVNFRDLRDAGDPVEVAARYAAGGADEIVVLDVAATPENRPHGLDLLRRLRARLDVPLTVGGGVRAVEDAAVLLEAGADKVAVNTAAVMNPELIDAIAARFGRQCAILAIDAVRRGEGWEVLVRGGRDATGRDAIAWAQDAVLRGAGEILLTSHDRDGTRAGYDLELVRALTTAVPVPVIASGGAGTALHLEEAFAAGAQAALVAGVLHDGSQTPRTLKEALAAGGRTTRR